MVFNLQEMGLVVIKCKGEIPCQGAERLRLKR
jgi:hypothetical protein